MIAMAREQKHMVCVWCVKVAEVVGRTKGQAKDVRRSACFRFCNFCDLGWIYKNVIDWMGQKDQDQHKE